MLGYLLMGGYVTARGLVIAQGRTLVQASNMGIAYGSLETIMSLSIVLGSAAGRYPLFHQPKLDLCDQPGADRCRIGRQPSLSLHCTAETWSNSKKGKRPNGRNPELGK